MAYHKRRHSMNRNTIALSLMSRQIANNIITMIIKRRISAEHKDHSVHGNVIQLYERMAARQLYGRHDLFNSIYIYIS